MSRFDPKIAYPLIWPLLIIVVFSAILFYFLPQMSPLKTLALAAGMIIFMISMVSTQAALFILIFSMLLGPEIIVGSTEGSTLGRGVTLRLDDFILLIIGFSWLTKMALYKEVGLFLKTPLNKPIGVYIIVCLLSTILGAFMGRVDLKTGLLFVFKYFEYMFIYFMVVNHLNDQKQVRHFLWALLFTCAVVSLFGIFQIPAGGRVSAPFEGAAGEPNTFGGYLIFMMGLVIGLFLTSNKMRDKLIFGFFSFLAFVPFLFTRSRVSYLAFFPMVLGFVWLSPKRKLIIFFLLFIVIFLPLLAPQSVKNRVLYTFEQRLHPGKHVYIGSIRLDTSTSARLRSWKRAILDTFKHPLSGYGVTGYSFLDAQFPRVLAETGLAGLIAFLYLLWAIFKQGIEAFRRAGDTLHKGISMGFVAGFIGLLVHSIGANTFIIVRIMEPFWFVLGMVTMIPELESNITSETR